MKLYEAGAVLLIIAGAMIGPIVPQHPLSLNAACGEAEGRDAWRKCLSKYRRTYETTAETCARAMKEIGAEYIKFPDAPGTWVVGKNEVLCIPAPTGLRR